MSPEEQAIGTSAAPAATPTGSRTLTAPQMAAFEREYYTMASDELKSRYRTDPEFRAKVDAMNAEPAPPEIEPESAPAPIASSATPLPEQIPVETAPASVAAPVEEPTATSKTFFKEGDRWVKVVDLNDGSGAQKFYGRTKDELIEVLGEAQVNATRKIRQQQAEVRKETDDRKKREKRAKDAELLLDNPEKVELKQYKSRQLTPEEQWAMANSVSDPAQFAKSMNTWAEATFGAPIQEVVGALNAAEQDRASQRAAHIGRVWVARNEDFNPSKKNIAALRDFMEERGWDVTEKNLDKAFRYLDAQDNVFEPRPEEVEEIVAPTPAQPAIPAAVTVAAAPATAAPAPALPAAAQPVPNITIPAIPGTTVLGMRPGSVSTALSPRDSSVRSGAQGIQPVGLTAEDYRRTPLSEIKRRMRTDPAYAAAVQKLWDEGKV